jgi:hypothetical protein
MPRADSSGYRSVARVLFGRVPEDSGGSNVLRTLKGLTVIILAAERQGHKHRLQPVRHKRRLRPRINLRAYVELLRSDIKSAMSAKTAAKFLK